MVVRKARRQLERFQEVAVGAVAHHLAGAPVLAVKSIFDTEERYEEFCTH